MTIHTYIETIDTIYPDGFARESLFRCHGDMLSPDARSRQGLVRRIVSAFSNWRMKRAGRLVLRDLTDGQLRDIGITHAERMAEVGKSRFLD